MLIQNKRIAVPQCESIFEFFTNKETLFYTMRFSQLANTINSLLNPHSQIQPHSSDLFAALNTFISSLSQLKEHISTQLQLSISLPPLEINLDHQNAPKLEALKPHLNNFLIKAYITVKALAISIENQDKKPKELLKITKGILHSELPEFERLSCDRISYTLALIKETISEIKPYLHLSTQPLTETKIESPHITQELLHTHPFTLAKSLINNLKEKIILSEILALLQSSPPPENLGSALISVCQKKNYTYQWFVLTRNYNLPAVINPDKLHLYCQFLETKITVLEHSFHQNLLGLSEHQNKTEELDYFFIYIQESPLSLRCFLELMPIQLIPAYLEFLSFQLTHSNSNQFMYNFYQITHILKELLESTSVSSNESKYSTLETALSNTLCSQKKQKQIHSLQKLQKALQSFYSEKIESKFPELKDNPQLHQAFASFFPIPSEVAPVYTMPFPNPESIETLVTEVNQALHLDQDYHLSLHELISAFQEKGRLSFSADLRIQMIIHLQKDTPPITSTPQRSDSKQPFSPTLQTPFNAPPPPPFGNPQFQSLNPRMSLSPLTQIKEAVQNGKSVFSPNTVMNLVLKSQRHTTKKTTGEIKKVETTLGQQRSSLAAHCKTLETLFNNFTKKTLPDKQKIIKTANELFNSLLSIINDFNSIEDSTKQTLSNYSQEVSCLISNLAKTLFDTIAKVTDTNLEKHLKQIAKKPPSHLSEILSYFNEFFFLYAFSHILGSLQKSTAANFFQSQYLADNSALLETIHTKLISFSSPLITTLNQIISSLQTNIQSLNDSISRNPLLTPREYLLYERINQDFSSINELFNSQDNSYRFSDQLLKAASTLFQNFSALEQILLNNQQSFILTSINNSSIATIETAYQRLFFSIIFETTITVTQERLIGLLTGFFVHLLQDEYYFSYIPFLHQTIISAVNTPNTNPYPALQTALNTRATQSIYSHEKARKPINEFLKSLSTAELMQITDHINPQSFCSLSSDIPKSIFTYAQHLKVLKSKLSLLRSSFPKDRTFQRFIDDPLFCSIPDVLSIKYSLVTQQEQRFACLKSSVGSLETKSIQAAQQISSQLINQIIASSLILRNIPFSEILPILNSLLAWKVSIEKDYESDPQLKTFQSSLRAVFLLIAIMRTETSPQGSLKTKTVNAIYKPPANTDISGSSGLLNSLRAPQALKKASARKLKQPSFESHEAALIAELTHALKQSNVPRLKKVQKSHKFTSEKNLFQRFSNRHLLQSQTPNDPILDTLPTLLASLK